MADALYCEDRETGHLANPLRMHEMVKEPDRYRLRCRLCGFTMRGDEWNDDLFCRPPETTSDGEILREARL